jgi:hypothetical protein
VIEGDVRVGGRVVVAAGAQVDGVLHAREAVIAGRVRGELEVRDTLTLRSSSVVDGTATAARLVVEEGSSGSVRLRIGDREFFDVVERQRSEAKAELDRVRARARRAVDRAASEVLISAPPASPSSTEALIESREMKEFLATKATEEGPGNSVVDPAPGKSESS